MNRPVLLAQTVAARRRRNGPGPEAGAQKCIQNSWAACRALAWATPRLAGVHGWCLVPVSSQLSGLSVLWGYLYPRWAGGGNGRATLTPEVVFIEKKNHIHTQCIHTLTLAGLVRKWWGRGTGAPRGLAIALVNEVAIAGHRATYLPFIG